MLKSIVKDINAVKDLKPFIAYYPRWSIYSLILLGIIASLSEGIGISLFIPLLNNVSEAVPFSASGNWFADFLRDLFIGIEPDSRFLVIVLCIFVSVVLRSSLSFGSDVLFTWVNMRITHRIRSIVFEKILTVSFRFIDKCPAGKLLNILSNETWRASDALSVFFTMIIRLSTVLVYFTILLLISWKLTLAVTVAMLLISAIVRRMTRNTKNLGQEVTRTNTELAGRMVQGIDGLKVIRAYARESYEQKRFDQTSRGLTDVLVKLGVIHRAVSPVYQVLTAALLAAVLLSSRQNTALIPSMLVFIIILYRLQPRITELDGLRISLVSLSPAVEEITSMLASGKKDSPSKGGTDFNKLEKAVFFNNVTFCYKDSEGPALKDISTSIPAGQTTALVGHSGAGKSTLIKLIMRFYDPSEGSICIDDRDLNELDIESWRKRISLVSQEAFVFNASVKDNISYGRLNASSEEIIEAARDADAHEFITGLPQGYDTMVGDRGVRLSGGQLQRITLARAIVRKPAILILDEATNSLDCISEKNVHDALEKMRLDCTVIVIAHRLSTVVNADKIVVLEKGRICEHGSFRELMQAGGTFSKLYNMQYEKKSLFLS